LALLANFPAEILLSKRISASPNVLPFLSVKRKKAQINAIILSPAKKKKLPFWQSNLLRRYPLDKEDPL
jgi:hypothetical protein